MRVDVQSIEYHIKNSKDGSFKQEWLVFTFYVEGDPLIKPFRMLYFEEQMIDEFLKNPKSELLWKPQFGWEPKTIELPESLRETESGKILEHVTLWCHWSAVKDGQPVWDAGRSPEDAMRRFIMSHPYL